MVEGIPHHNLIAMALGFAALACLFIWLLLRNRSSRKVTAIYMLTAVLMSTLGLWVLLGLFGPSVFLADSTLLSIALVMLVGLVVWSAYRERPHGVANIVLAASELLLLEMPVLVFLGLFLFFSGSPMVLGVSSVLLLSAVIYRTSRRDFISEGISGHAAPAMVLLMLLLVLRPLLFPVVHSMSLTRTLILSLALVALVSCITACLALVTTRKSGSALENGAYAMLELALLLTVWQVIFLVLTAQVPSGMPPAPPNPYYGFQILVCDLFSLLAVLIIRLLLAVWHERAVHMGGTQFKQIDTARDLS